MLRHLGIIADGNRRWAKERGLPTIEGHRRGVAKIEELVAAAGKLGVEYITFYVWSTENWSRSEEEVSYLMKMAGEKIPALAKKMAKNNVKMLILGSPAKVDPKLLSKLREAEKLTENCDGITACFCFNYGGEQEIADAATIAAKEGEITPETIRAHLYHPEVPNVDLVARTSGEERTSGFMLWRAAYAELLFLPQYFPEMTVSDLENALSEYEKRERRFGK